MKVRKWMCGAVAATVVLTAFWAVAASGAGSPKQPVLWYKFDETAGAVVRDSVGDVAGAIAGTAYEWSNTGLNLKNGTDLAGEDAAYVQLPAEAFVQPALRDVPYDRANNLTSFTVSFWLSVTTDNPYQRYLEVGDGAGDIGRAFMWIADFRNGDIVWCLTDGSAARTQFDLVADLDTAPKGPLAGSGWRHIAVTLAENEQGILYVDGQMMGTKTFPSFTAVDLSQGQNWLGKTIRGEYGYNGKFDDFRVYDTALSAADVSGLYEAKAKPDEPDAWYKLDETSGAAARDAVAGLNASVINGQYAWGTLGGAGLDLQNGTARDAAFNSYVMLPVSALTRPEKRFAVPYDKNNNLTNFTMSLWVNVRTNNLYQRYLEFGDSRSGHADFMWLANFQNDNVIWTITTNNNTDTHSIVYNTATSPKGGFSLGGWRHLALTLEDTGGGYGLGRMYVDGVEVGRNTLPLLTQINLGRGQNWLGRTGRPEDFYYDGALSDFRIYARALDAEAIAAIAGETPAQSRPLRVSFRTSGPYIKAGRDFSVTAAITNPSREAEKVADALLVLAVYAPDGRLFDVKPAPVSGIARDYATATATIRVRPEVDVGYRLQYYLWEDGTYIPLVGHGAAEVNPNPDPLPDDDPVPEGLAEKWNATLRFDGANSYTAERRVQDDMSVAFWIQTTQAAANTALSYQGTALFTADMAGVRDDFGVSMGGPSAGAGKIIFGIGAEGGADHNIRGLTTVNDGQWHHVVCTRRKSDNTLQIFVDGRLDASAVYHDVGRPLNDPQYIVIGARGDVQKSYGGNKGGNATPTDQGMFIGRMSDIRFYDRVLPSEDVVRLRDADAPAVLPAVPKNASGYLRVMTMGDSITYGYSNTQVEEQTGGYRQQLWKRLTRAGVGVEFVGRQTNGPDYVGAHNHEGWSGSVIQDHLDNLHHQMANRPDIVALMIGTNDINAYWQSNQAMLDTAPGRLNTLIDRIFETFRANGTVNGKLYVALSTKRTPSASGSVTGTIMDRIDAYNEAVARIVDARKQAGENIELVDMYTPLQHTQPDMYDGLHPTLAGYAKMGDVWFDALKGDFGVVGDRVNLASGASVSASAGTNAPAATDAELSTAWEAEVADRPFITVDLGEVKSFTRVMTQFGFPRAGYYYKLEASDNGTDWTPLVDKTAQTSTESVYIDDVEASARYVRLTVTDSVVRPARMSLWDMKILQ
ncbi:MAG: GDSL-type esterase/lipase family protein [Oscillospiraceae bacterium]|jgi:lysophospholipase L1-like esterase|nr:GDSL-type esterase/lipase family protein [Oscillospiraceae bacterium]